MDIDELCINTVRMLSLDMVQRANSGHPGMPLGAAPMAYVLWSRFLRYNPKNPAWQDRDRFVLSAGHGSALLYSILHLTGYDISIDELKRFRQWGSLTPGHPESNIKYGIEATTGPLGQGFANGVGMAIAERQMAAKFNRPGHEIVNHYTYAIVSDGDLMEGISAEAASLAGHLRLGRLIYLYDSNGITLAGETKLTFTEDACKRFDSYGWHVQSVKDGNDIEAIEKAVERARAETTSPSLIAISTHIGHGSPKHDTFGVHGSPLSPDEVIATKRFYDWPLEPEFYLPEDALAHFSKASEKGAGINSQWDALLSSYGDRYPDLLKEWKAAVNRQLPEGWDSDIPIFPPDPKGIATRVAGGKVMNSVARHLSLIGGSGDLDPSTNTTLAGKGSFQCPGTGSETLQGAVSGNWGYDGSNIAFGVREHAMGGILNGIALHNGLTPFGSTFLVFSDYMRPAIRLAALSKLHVIYIFTHDSIALGQDGPTHQPIEHISGMRCMPGLTVIRPCDANETAEAWKVAIRHSEGPVALILTRQNVPVIDRTRYSSAEGLRYGAYILAESSPGNPDLIFMATGSEVHATLKASEILMNEGVKTRVVSMPSWELFEKQPVEYRNSVLPPEVTARVSVEAAATFGWHRYVGASGEIIGIDCFGASAQGEVLLEKFGFTVENILNKARGILKKS